MPNLFNVFVHVTFFWGIQWNNVHSMTTDNDYQSSLASAKHEQNQILRHDRKKLRRGEQQPQRSLTSQGISYAYKTLEGNSMNGLNHAPKLTGVNDTRVQPSDKNETIPIDSSPIMTSEKVKIPTFEMKLTVSSKYASFFDEHNLLKETFEYLLPRYGQEFSPKYHLDYLMIAISDEYPIRRRRRRRRLSGTDNDGGTTTLSRYFHGELTFRDTDKSPAPSISEVISLTLSLLQSSSNAVDGDNDDKLSNKKFLQRLQSSVDPALRSVSRIDVSLSILDDNMFGDGGKEEGNDGDGGGVPVGVNPSAIIGGVFIGIALCLSVIVFAMFITRRRRRKEEQLKTIVETYKGMMDDSGDFVNGGDFDDSSSVTFENGQYYRKQQQQHQTGRSSSRVPRNVRGGQRGSRYPPGMRSNASSLHGSSLHNDIESIADMSMDDFRFDTLIGVGVDVDKRRFGSNVPFRSFEAKEVVNGMDGAVLVDESCWHRYAYPSPNEQINQSSNNQAALKAKDCPSDTRSEIVTMSSLDGGSVMYDSDDYLKAESATLHSYTTYDDLDFSDRHIDHESPSFDSCNDNDDVSAHDEKRPIDEEEEEDGLNEENNNNDDDDHCEAKQQQDSSFISSSDETYVESFQSEEDENNFNTVNENDITIDLHIDDNTNDIHNDDNEENDHNKNPNDKKNDNSNINSDSDQDDTSVIISQQEKNDGKIHIPLPHDSDQQQQQQHDDENRDVPTTKTNMLTYTITTENRRERSPSSNFSSSASQRSNSSSISDERRSEATDEKNDDDGRSSSSSPLFLCDVDDSRVSL